MDPLYLGGLIFLGLFLLYWIGVAAIAAFIWFMGVAPYLVFFIMPFLTLSLLAGVSWALGCGLLSPRDKAGVRVFRSSFDYRMLGILIPVCVLFAMVVVQIPMEHQIIVKGWSRETVIQMPWVFALFEEFKEWWRGLIPSLTKRALIQGHSVFFDSFDRNDLSVSVWVALLFGAPIVFWFLSKAHQAEELGEQKSYEENLVSRERAFHEYKIERVESQLKEVHEQVLRYQGDLKREEAKVRALEARLTHAAPQMPGLPVKIEQLGADEKQKSGLLESDLF